jgi:serine/threonine-protein kinase
MFKTALSDVHSGPGLAEVTMFTETGTLLDEALALAFAPADRGGDPAGPGVDRSPSFPTSVAGRYRDIEPIAHGGQGVVVRVRDADLGRELALKTIHADPAGDGQARARLETEARVLAFLEHPGVPPVHERGSLPDGRPFFTMRLVQGRTLAELVAESAAAGRLESERPRYVHLFEQICRTVAYAHRKGIIHRDLKPGNVMVGAFGEVQVMDWGLARPIDADPAVRGGGPYEAQGRESFCPSERPGTTPAADTSTLPGQVVGTAAYMPLEQARGWSDRQGPASDVFGLGGILCVLLTGSPPYAASDQRDALARAAVGDLGDALARLDSSGADPALIRLARACLAVAPEDRMPDAGAVVESLGEYVVQVDRRLREAEVGRARAEARAAGERRRRRLALALGGTMALAVCLGSGLWDLRRRQEGALERALAHARALYDKARDSGHDLPRWRELHVAMRNLEALVEHGMVRSPTGRRAGDLLDRFRLDDATLGRLERIHLDHGNPGRDGVIGDTGLAAEYDSLFRSYGVEIRASGPADAAPRLRRGAIPIPLCGALDAWAMLREGAERSRLLETAGLADPDPARNQIRRALRDAAADPAPLVAMAASLDVGATTPATAMLLAGALDRLAERDRAVDVLWHAYSHSPGDFWINHSLGRALLKSGRHRAIDAVPFLTAATALHPESAGAWLSLANALRRAHGRGQAEAAYQKAEAAYREVLRRDPGDHLSRAYLGVILRSGGRMAEALDVLDPVRPGESESAIALQARGTLAFALGDYETAERCSRAALKREPGFVLAHVALGQALVNRGRFSEARRILLEARGLVEAGGGRSPQLERTLLRCDDFLRQEGASGRVLGPIAYADYLRIRGEYAGAAEAYARALGPGSAQGADLPARFQAAMAAARAAGAAGPDVNAGPRDRWLGLALGWLRDATADWGDRIVRDPVRDLPGIRGALEALRVRGDLAAVRDREGLARLPEGRRVAWEAFWADVAALRDRCERLREEVIASPRVPVRGPVARKGRAPDEENPDGPSRRRDDLLEPDPEGVGR